MMKRQSGFTLIEIIVVMAIIGLSLALSSDMLLGLLNQYKQQGKIAETNIEGMIGLDLMRQDIERAGYGLPWVIGVAYQEASEAGASAYNDSPNNPPRPIVNGNNTEWAAPGSGVGNSDCLVIKAANVARNDASQKWTYLLTTGTHTWSAADSSAENLQNGDYAIVLTPGTSVNDTRTLVSVGGVWGPQQAGGTFASFLPLAADPQPLFVYGITNSSGGPLRMPFNRADYYIADPMDPSTANSIPARCAPNTSILVKSVIGQGTGALSGRRTDKLPILDCVADMKVIFRLDTNGDGTIDTASDTLIVGGTPLTAQQIRTQVREIRVYILAHEGQKDPTYTQNPTIIPVGDFGLTHNYNLGTNVNYRWKLYTIVVQPKNMRQ
jgi:prepilin-type N-terminal cleavage/methylation domain-containing protein